MSRRPVMRTLLKHSKNSKLPLCPFLKAQISSHLHEMLTQVNKIIRYINLYQISNQLKNSGINISCTVIFLRNELRFRDISDYLVRIFLSF